MFQQINTITEINPLDNEHCASKDGQCKYCKFIFDTPGKWTCLLLNTSLIHVDRPGSKYILRCDLCKNSVIKEV